MHDPAALRLAVEGAQLNRAAALAAVACILERLACWDNEDDDQVDDADARTCVAWPLQADTLRRAAGSGFAGPLLDAAVELRRHADEGMPHDAHT